MRQIINNSPQPEDDRQHEQARRSRVGIFDSGVGGFTVLKALLSRRPDLDIVYFGDSLNAPNGSRPPEQLHGMCHNMVQFLVDQGVDIMAVGCNSCNILMGSGELKSYGIASFDLVSSTVDWLKLQHHKPQNLAILATQATINSRYYERKLQEAFPELPIRSMAAPKLVPLIESFPWSEYDLRTAVQEYLNPLLEEGFNNIVLACSHYRWIERYLRELDSEMTLIDPAECLAERLVATLPAAPEGARRGELRLYSSHPNEAFSHFAEMAIGRDAKEYIKLFIVNPYEEHNV
ncbi:aspartate/glutamate racemase family protein [bacterium]|nr:aspartate/glutamate racemase family protein [bacterium]MCB1221185.1 aspartate/glutamate racemase family protein [bacterium]UNM08046.1 MAG: aspartate/glutamate racemase family protein [Planctomycetales bacterium]